MAKKIVYIAHPYASNPKQNLKAVYKIIKELTLDGNVIPYAPWIPYVLALDDTNPGERGIGILNTCALMDRKIVNELWLYGDHISQGMIAEINQAQQQGIQVVNMTATITERMLKKAYADAGLPIPKIIKAKVA